MYMYIERMNENPLNAHPSFMIIIIVVVLQRQFKREPTIYVLSKNKTNIIFSNLRTSVCFMGIFSLKTKLTYWCRKTICKCSLVVNCYWKMTGVIYRTKSTPVTVYYFLKLTTCLG